MSKSIGVIEESRLGLIPSKYWAAHEFCFYIHDQILAILIEYENKGAHRVIADAVNQALAEKNFQKEKFDLIDFLKDENLGKEYQHHLISHCVMGLTSDMLNFIFEALSCFEKRKFSVAFSLLRKPLKENLLFLSWILASPQEFVKSFEADTSKTLNNLDKNKQLEIFEAAIKQLDVSDLFSSEVIWGLLFSKTNGNSFEVIWQRATHLITTYGEHLKTEPYEINFVFEHPLNDELYDSLYSFLPHIMLYVLNVCLKCFNQISGINENTYAHLLMTITGCSEVIIPGSDSKLIMGKYISDTLGNFLKCSHCKQPLRINRSNALKLYIHEIILCKKCGLDSQIPLYWLFAQANLSITKKS
jgi:hypothetical protein